MISPAELVVFAFAVYRCTRFVILDSFFEGTRDRVDVWLETRRLSAEGWRSTAWGKIHSLALCAFCQSVYFATAAYALYVAAGPVAWTWLSILDVLAISAAAMAVYRFVDPPE